MTKQTPAPKTPPTMGEAPRDEHDPQATDERVTFYLPSPGTVRMDGTVIERIERESGFGGDPQIIVRIAADDGATYEIGEGELVPPDAP